MNVEDYLYVYFNLVGKAAELYPTTDKDVVYNFSSHDTTFYSIVQKVGEERMTQQLRQLFIEMVENGILKGTVTKQLVIINAVTPLGYMILDKSKEPSF